MAVPTETSAPTRAFTIHDLFEMPDDGYRYEVLDGALIVSPAPDSLHQYVGDIIGQVLRDNAPHGVFAITGVAVRIGEDTTTFIPDVVVTTVNPRARRRWLEAHEVLTVVETVSPSSKRRDRLLKSEVYAGIGIPCYWRVELGRVSWILVDGIRDPDGGWQGGGGSSYRAYSDPPTTQPAAIWARRPRPRSTRHGLDPEPTVFVYLLDGDTYRLVDTLPTGKVCATAHPFPVRFDPGAL